MHTIYKFEWLMETRRNAEGNDDVQQMNQVKIITKNESTMLIVISYLVTSKMQQAIQFDQSLWTKASKAQKITLPSVIR